MELTDDELMSRCRSGDSRAMDALVSRYYQRLYNFSYRMLHQREAAEDVAQETLLRAYHNAARYRAQGYFSNWLFAIAANLCRSELRRKARRPEHAWDEMGEIESGVCVERTAMRHIEYAEVCRALEQLTPDHRMALALFYFENMSYQDIAQICGCSLGTVKSRLHYALARLRGLVPATEAVPTAMRGAR